MENYVKIVGYRSYIDKKGKEKSKQIFFEDPFHFKDHATMFDQLDNFLEASIPRAERYNLHYTIHNLIKGAKDKKQVSHVQAIPLDIDHVNLERVDDYLTLVEEVFRVQRDSFVSLVTGNGIQCLFSLDKPLTEAEYLSLRASYVLKCDQLEERIEQEGLKKVFDEDTFTHCDTGVLRIGTLRLPGTINSKKGKNTNCEILTKELSPVSLTQLGLYFEHLPVKKEKVVREYGSVQSEYIMKNCAALKDFKDREGKVSYSHWFNAASIVSRFTDVDGPKTFHDISKGHPDYLEEETQKMIDYTLESGGPVGCAKFSESFKGCQDCKYLKTKLKSPINLRDKSFLPNEHTGFHMQVQSGNRVSWVPVLKEIVAKFEQEYTYVSTHHSEDLFFFNEDTNRWEFLTKRKLQSVIKDYTLSKPGDYPRSTLFSEVMHHIELAHLVEDAEFFEASRGKVNFSNGHIEVVGTTLKFFPKSVDSLVHRFMFSLPYEYDPEAKAPLFEKFIADICSDDEDKALSLCEYIGYVISNDVYWAHKFMVLEGDGSNGKSVLLEVIRALCGEGNYSSLKVTDLSNEQQRFNLIGKMANICDETEKGSLTKSADVKNLTSGGIFTFKQVYSKPGEARNRAKFIFSSNHSFETTDSTGGMIRRYMPIPLDAVFKEEGRLEGPHQKVADPQMSGKLLTELPGIWNYCISKYLEAKKRKSFTVCRETQAKLTDFAESSNPMRTYLNSYLSGINFKDAYEADAIFQKSPTILDVKDTVYEEYTRIPTNDLRKDYNLWLQDLGKTGVYADGSFSRLLARELTSIIPDAKVREKVFKQSRVGRQRLKVLLCKWTPFNS